MNCPGCGSKTNRSESGLGSLGYLMWYRCRYCGAEFSRSVRRGNAKGVARVAKKAAAVVVLLLTVATAQARSSSDVFLSALEMVESSGNPNAIGDKRLLHRAYGILQIRQPYLEDVNRIARKEIMRRWGKSSLTLDDMKDRDKARWAVKVYLAHYGERYRRATGQIPTYQVLARIHNGGPAGWRKSSTERYERKVMAQMGKVS